MTAGTHFHRRCAGWWAGHLRQLRRNSSSAQRAVTVILAIYHGQSLNADLTNADLLSDTLNPSAPCD